MAKTKEKKEEKIEKENIKKKSSGRKRAEKKESEKNKKGKKRREFFEVLENRLLDFGEVLLKKGLASLAISQINNTEEKIKKELEEKFKKYQNKLFKNTALFVAGIFISYGAFSLLMFKLEMTEYTNLAFGGIFLLAYLLLNLKD